MLFVSNFVNAGFDITPVPIEKTVFVNDEIKPLFTIDTVSVVFDVGKFIESSDVIFFYNPNLDIFSKVNDVGKSNITINTYKENSTEKDSPYRRSRDGLSSIGKSIK